MRKDSDSSPHNKKRGSRNGGREGGWREAEGKRKKERRDGGGEVRKRGPENGIKEGGKSQVGLGPRSRRGSTGRKE